MVIFVIVIAPYVIARQAAIPKRNLLDLRPGSSPDGKLTSTGLRTASGDLAWHQYKASGRGTSPADRPQQVERRGFRDEESGSGRTAGLGSSFEQANQPAADDFDPAWQHMLRTLGIVAASVVGGLILVLLLIMCIYRASDRSGVDEGEVLPEVSAEAAEEAGKTTAVGYDKEKEEISLWQGFSEYEETMKERCGVGMQGYVALQHRLFCLFLFLPLFVIPLLIYNSQGSGKMVDVPLGGYTMANVEVNVTNAVRMQESYSLAKPSDASFYVAMFDATGALVLLVFFGTMIYSTFPKMQADQEEKYADMSNFAIRIEALPPSLPEGNDDYESKLSTAVVEHVESASGVSSAEVKELTLIRTGHSEAVALLARLETLDESLEIEKEKHRSAEVKRLEEEVASVKADLAKLPNPKTQDVVCAFVILGDSAHAQSAPGSLTQAPFDGALVHLAPEPEDVNWAHQSKTKGQRTAGTVISFFLKSILFAGFFALGTWLLLQKEAMTDDVECNDPLTGEVRESTKGDCLSAYASSFDDKGISPYANQHCLCRGVGVVAIFQDRDLWRPCDSYMNRFVIGKYWLFLFLFLIVLLSPVFRKTMNALGNTMECPITYSERESSAFVGNLLLILSMKFAIVAIVMARPLGLYEFASRDWLYELSETLLLSTAIMVVAELWVRLFFGVIVPFVAACFAGPFLFSHQKKANAAASFRLYFEPAERLAELTGLVGGLIIFSAMIPPFVVGCFLFIILIAFLDRIYLLRGASREQLAFDLTLPYMALWALVLCVFLHALLAAYVFGHPLLFPGVLLNYNPAEDEGFDRPSIYNASAGKALGWHLRSLNALPSLCVAALCVFFFLYAIVAAMIGKAKKSAVGDDAEKTGEDTGENAEETGDQKTSAKFDADALQAKGKLTSYVPSTPNGISDYLNGTFSSAEEGVEEG